MSALAARRAAAAIAKAPHDVSGDVIDRSKASSQPKKASVPTEKPVSESSANDKISSNGRKRRRLEESSPKAPPAPARVVLSSKPPSKSDKGKRRAFSPSAPVSDFDDSSDEADSNNGQGEVLDGNNATWSGAVTPAIRNSPGPSRPRHAPIATSSWVPQRGVNLYHLDVDRLSAAGILSDHSGVAIRLAPGETLVLHGMYQVVPIHGPLHLLSTTLRPNVQADRLLSYPVFAPGSHPLPVISPGPASEPDEDLTFELDRRRRLDLPDSFYLPGHATFILLPNACGLGGLNRAVVPHFSNIWPHETSWGLAGVKALSGNDIESLYPYECPSTWTTALDRLYPAVFPMMNGSSVNHLPTTPTEPTAILVRGPKRVGKSTFARAAVNRLLERRDQVAWLECDLGQNEFSCGGTVGLWLAKEPLLGPPFTHPKIPIHAHYLGAYTPLSCPDEYLSCIRQLFELYRTEYAHVPLVINTQGWVKGLGEDLLHQIMIITEPTHICTFEVASNEDIPDANGWTSSPSKPMASLPNRNGTGPEELSLEPAPESPLQARHTSADLRLLSLMSCLHSRLGSHATRWDFSAPLAAMQPWEVNVGSEGPIRQIYLEGEGSDGVNPADLPLALNGAVVGLLRCPETPGELYVQGRVMEDRTAVSCLGLGIIRGVRVTSTGMTIHLLTPLSPKSLGDVHAIIKNGVIELPTCGLLDWREENQMMIDGKRWDEMPFMETAEIRGFGIERRRYRRNIMRKGM